MLRWERIHDSLLELESGKTTWWDKKTAAKLAAYLSQVQVKSHIAVTHLDLTSGGSDTSLEGYHTGKFMFSAQPKTIYILLISVEN